MGINREEAWKMRRLLWRWGSALYFIRQKEEELAALRGMIDEAYDTLKSAGFGDDILGGNMPSSSVERAVEDVSKRAEEYKRASGVIHKQILDTLRMKDGVDEAIETLEPIEQKVLSMRYIDNHRWAYVGLRLQYDLDAARKIERKALEKLSKVIRIE